MTPGRVDERIVREWLRRADDDMQNARAILKHRDGTPAQVCFLAQQAVEKIAKAALAHFTGDIPFAHELPFLATALRAHLPRLSKDFPEALKRLSEYYVTARYPTDVPYESFTWERAEEAFADAERIGAAVRAVLR